METEIFKLREQFHSFLSFHTPQFESLAAYYNSTNQIYWLFPVALALGLAASCIFTKDIELKICLIFFILLGIGTSSVIVYAETHHDKVSIAQWLLKP